MTKDVQSTLLESQKSLEKGVAENPFKDYVESEVDDFASEAIDTIASKTEDTVAWSTVRSSGYAPDSIKLYLRDIGFISLLESKAELKLTRAIRKGDENARRQLIEANLRLVVKIAARYRNRGVPFSDLIAEGNLGLMHATEKFDPERGFRFCTYATYWIQQNVDRAVMNMGRVVRLPIHIHRELNGYKRAACALAKQLSREPSVSEVAEHVDKPVKNVGHLFELDQKISSIDAPMMSDSDKTLGHTIADARFDPMDLLGKAEITRHLEDWLTRLDDLQRSVLVRRFGLEGHEKMTLERVGEALGITRERVRQIQIRAIRALRVMMEEVGL